MNKRIKVTYNLRSLGSGNPATEEGQYNSYFSLPPLYLILPYSGEEGVGVV